MQGLRDTNTQQGSRREELERMRDDMSRSYESNDIETIAKATLLQERVREIERELLHAKPVEEY